MSAKIITLQEGQDADFEKLMAMLSEDDRRACRQAAMLGHEVLIEVKDGKATWLTRPAQANSNDNGAR